MRPEPEAVDPDRRDSDMTDPVGVDGVESEQTGHADSGRSNLERRYRALLLVLLPGWYRAEREDEMVGIFLSGRGDGLDLEYGWPGWGEAAATLGLSVRVRLGARRPAGAVVRLVALTGLVGLLVGSAQSWTVLARFGSPGGAQGWWFDALAVAAFAGVVSGRRVVGRVAAGLLGLAALVPFGSVLVAGLPVWWSLVWHVPLWVAVVAVLVGFHREAPSVSGRWWVVGVCAVVLGVVSVLFVALSLLTVLVAWVIAVGVVVVVRPWAGVPGGVAAGR